VGHFPVAFADQVRGNLGVVCMQADVAKHGGPTKQSPTIPTHTLMLNMPPTPLKYCKRTVAGNIRKAFEGQLTLCRSRQLLSYYTDTRMINQSR
jgi:hypothetical protein